jgi:hemerythrin-like domain-containing protein
MSDLCESLEAEHRMIELVLDALERETRKVVSGAGVDREFFTKAIIFVREFADGLHHQKEESILFPHMAEAGVPREGGPIGVMLYEHDEGRHCVRQMSQALDQAAAGDAQARRALSEAALDYVALLRAHIMKEDQVLFPMADRVFDERQKGTVRAGFSEAEAADPRRDEAHRTWAQGLA